MKNRDAGALPLEDWMVWLAVRDTRLSPAGLQAIRALLAEKESQLSEDLPETPFIPPALDAE